MPRLLAPWKLSGVGVVGELGIGVSIDFILLGEPSFRLNRPADRRKPTEVLFAGCDWGSGVL